MVGAARKLATELVVIMASATHEIQAVVGTALTRDSGLATGLSAGTSIVLMSGPSQSRQQRDGRSSRHPFRATAGEDIVRPLASWLPPLSRVTVPEGRLCAQLTTRRW